MAARTSGSIEAEEDEEVVEELDADDDDDDEIADDEKHGAAPLRREGLMNVEAAKCLLLTLISPRGDAVGATLGVLGTWRGETALAAPVVTRRTRSIEKMVFFSFLRLSQSLYLLNPPHPATHSHAHTHRLTHTRPPRDLGVRARARALSSQELD